MLQRIPEEFEEMEKARPSPTRFFKSIQQQHTAMLQLPAASSLVQESGSGVVPASSTVVVAARPGGRRSESRWSRRPCRRNRSGRS